MRMVTRRGRGEIPEAAREPALAQVALDAALLPEQLVEPGARRGKGAAEQRRVELGPVQIALNVALDGRQAELPDEARIVNLPTRPQEAVEKADEAGGRLVRLVRRQPVDLRTQQVERTDQQAARGRAPRPEDCRRVDRCAGIEPIAGDARPQDLAWPGRDGLVLAAEIELPYRSGASR